MVRPILIFVALVICGLGRAMGAATQPATHPSDLPRALAGWKVEVVAQTPVVIDPTMVCVAPDGRVFVGQQTAAMENHNVMEPRDSIVCVHPDGRVTTFAIGLYNLFGLAYLDGKVFVTQYPKVTAFTDVDSVGKNPVDLFTVSPFAGGYQQHIAGNMRYAMDGYFYQSIGDRGLFKTVTKEGETLEMRGGTVRWRPDGSGLEIYSTGSRNHPDLAIDANDEIFTLDNTDDGAGWNVRLSHLVDGGSYGYPHEYSPPRTWALWCMEDLGGGSPTGAVAYNEDALPAEYRGNLFMCEWGKQQLIRFGLEENGATFKMSKREDVLSAGPATKEFRPVGIAVSADGLGFYLADWHSSGWREQKKIGRLLKVTWIGASAAAAKPKWWAAAGMNKPFEATNEQLLAALSHPAQTVRMVAQRRLVDRGAAVVKPLVALLADAGAPAMAREHAIWALDGIDGGVAARAQIMEAAAGGDVAVRSQAIRQLGTRRVKEAVKVLLTGLKDGEAVIRFRAAVALGRIGADVDVVALSALLSERDAFVRYGAFHAMNRIGVARPAAWAEIAKGLNSSDKLVREGTLFAMRETYDVENVKALAAFVASDGDAETRVAALGFLAELHRRPMPWDGKWWSNQPAKAPAIPKTVEWEGTPMVCAVVTKALGDGDAAVSGAAIHAAAVARDVDAGKLLAHMFEKEKDVSVRKALVRALCACGGEAANGVVRKILSEPEKNADVLPEAISGAGRSGDRALAPLLFAIADGNAESALAVSAINALGSAHDPSGNVALLVKLLGHTEKARATAASEVLGKIGGEAVFAAVLPLLDDAKSSTRRAAIAAIGPQKNTTIREKLIAASKDAETKSAAVVALSLVAEPKDLDLFLAALSEKDRACSDAADRAIRGMREKVLGKIEEKQRAAAFGEPVLRRLQSIYEAVPGAKQGPLFAGAAGPVDAAVYEKFAMGHDGDAAKGRKLFETGACVACHKVDGIGAEVGPDLSGVGSKYGRAQLVESVLYPSKVILDGFGQTIVELKNGVTVSGVMRGETAEAVQIVDTAGVHAVAKKEFASQRQSQVSMMPEGVHQGMTTEEFGDLIGYLESLKEKVRKP